MIIEVKLVKVDALDQVPERLRLEGGHVRVTQPSETAGRRSSHLFLLRGGYILLIDVTRSVATRL